jgi:hypothetical protein
VKQLIALSIAVGIGFAAQAQNNPNKNGQPISTSATQPTAGTAAKPPTGGQPAQGQQPMPGSMNQGQPMQGNQPTAGTAAKPPAGGQPTQGSAWPAEKCQKELGNVTKMADNCLQIKAQDKRRACFDQIGKKVPAGFMEGCRAQVEPKKAEYEAKEKSMYPDQTSTMNGNQQGQQTQGGQKEQAGKAQPGQKETKAVDCVKVVDKIRKSAEACLKTKEAAKRKACFEKIGEEVRRSGAEQSCADLMSALKSEVQGREAQMYPGQASSIH